jgi:hypothetical protein
MKLYQLHSEINLIFETIELTSDTIFPYIRKKWETVNRRISPFNWTPSTFASGIRRNLVESISPDIQQFIEKLTQLDSKRKIKIGDSFSVLVFEIGYGWKEIAVSGFISPKIVSKINCSPSGKIYTIEFDDGAQFPRYPPADFERRPVEYAIYFPSKIKAETALTFMIMSTPLSWEIIIDPELNT